MKFDVARRRVERSEQLVEGRALQTGVRAKALKTTWRESWTPTRIVVSGLALGFLAGRSDPTRALKQIGNGGRWVQMIGALSGLFASLQSSLAAATADKAADHADQAADQAGDAAATAAAAQGMPPQGVPSQDTPPKSAQPQGTSPQGTSPQGTSPQGMPPPRSDRRRPDPAWDTPPAPAEAATDVSER